MHHDPASRELAQLFARMARDPWFPVDAIPKRYLVKDEPTPPAPAPLPEVEVRDDGGSTMMMGELLLPKQKRRELPAAPVPAAITAKEN